MNNLRNDIKKIIFELYSENNDVTLEQIVLDFLKEIEIYQSNHYGAYNRNDLVNVYNKLPDKIRKILYPKSTKNLFRGTDGISNKPAISFTDNRNNALLYGTFALPFSLLEKYNGLIDTGNILKSKIFTNIIKKYNLEIGDDENEIIVISPKWKEGIKLDLYR
jgi:hypothetical protein